MSISHMNHLLPFYLQLLRKLWMQSEKWQLIFPQVSFNFPFTQLTPHPLDCILVFFVTDKIPKTWLFMQDTTLSLWLYMIIAFLEKESNVNIVFFFNYPQAVYLKVIFLNVHYIRHLYSNVRKKYLGKT